MKEKKVWGEVQHLFHCDEAALSSLKVNKGYRCSRHFHKERANLFFVQSGIVAIETWTGVHCTGESQLIMLNPGQTHVVNSGVWHRFRVVRSGSMIELYWPDNGGKVKQKDIVRFDEGGRDDINELESRLSCHPDTHIP